MLNKIVLDGKKNMSINNTLIDKSEVKYVYIPLINNGIKCKSLVKIGKKVRKDTIIGVREDIDFPILSSVSGKVVAIEDHLYLDNTMVECIKIENDYLNKVVKKVKIDNINSYKREEFLDILKRYAVVGMGGSDFPTYLKFKGEIDTLIVNAFECEPYITSDYTIVRYKLKEILDGINATMIINNIKKCYIAVKAKDKDTIMLVKEQLNNYINIEIKELKDVYPMGYERYLVKSILDIEYDKYPSEKNIVVNNISTMYSIYKALKFQTSISKRVVTISGEMFSKPTNLLLRIGTDLRPILKKLGGYKRKNNLKIIAGGPMMGQALKSDNVIVTRNLNSILIIGDYVDYEETPCLRCGRCDNMCPVNISPVLIKDNINDNEELKKLNVEKCMECGICSYVCPSKIDLRNYVKIAKSGVNK